MIVNLTAGAYSVIESGKTARGIGLVEFTTSLPAPDQNLANISTRGFVDQGENVMIAGFNHLERGRRHRHDRGPHLGPSLGVAGVANALSDPSSISARPNGLLLAANDN